MNSSRITTLFLIVVFQGLAFGAKKEKPCYLNLVATNERPDAVVSSSNQDHRFLNFVRDLKGFGFEFESIHPESVKQEFKRVSSENLTEFIENYKIWLYEQNREPLPYKASEMDFVFWRDRISSDNGIKGTVLNTHRDTLRKANEQHKNLWMTTTRGFGGVLFNMEALKVAPEDFVSQIQGNGVARVALKDSFETDWVYALPLPGSTSGDYSAFDFRFFTFIRVFAPDLFEDFFNDLQFMVPNGLTERGFFRGEVLFHLGALNAKSEGLKVLDSWRREFHKLILSEEDAAYLLSFIAAQQPTRKNASFLEPPFDAIHNLTVVISGTISPEDYLIKERPYIAPYVERNGVSSGWKLRSAPRGVPNMTGDDDLIPSGPDMH